jgi:L-Ala-D/L-Glu epimerase
MIEQPLPVGMDCVLKDFQRTIPICADESVTDAASLQSLDGKDDLVNLKLDKTGGLSEALKFLTKTTTLGLGVTIGNYPAPIF